MKFKRYFKSFFKKSSSENSKHHHKRKAAIFWNKFLRILTIKFVALLTIIFFLLFFGVAYAQAPIHELINRINKPKPITESSAILSQNIQQAITDEAENEINEEQARKLLASDLSVTSENNITGLSSSETRPEEPTLFQSIGEAFEEATTTDQVAKAKIRLRKIDRKIVKLQKFLENDRSDEAINQAVALIKEIGDETNSLVKDPKVQEDREILGLQIEQYNRLQLVLQKIEDTLPIEAYLKIEDARVKFLVSGAQASLNAAPNLDVTNNVAFKEVRSVVGEDFAELKAIEILTDIGAGVSPQVKQKLAGLQKELALQFEKRMLQLPHDARNKKLQDYIKFSNGNPINQVRSFNQIQHFLTDREMILQIDSLKELALKRLEKRLFELKTPELEEQFNTTVLTDPADIKILIQAQLDIEAGEDENKKKIIGELSERGQQSAIKIFGKDKNLLLSTFSENANPDVLDILLVNRLEKVLGNAQEVTPEIKQTIKEIKQKTLQHFVGNISKKDFVTPSKLGYNPVSDHADVRLLQSSPQSLLLLGNIKSELSEKDKPKITLAEKANTALVSHHLLEDVTDPAIFSQYYDFITGSPQIKQLVQNYENKNFFVALDTKQQMLDKQVKRDEQHLYEVIQQITQAIFITKKTTDFERRMPSDIQQITQFKKSLPEKSIPQLTVPNGVRLPKIAKLPSSVEQAIVQAAKAKIKDKTKSEDVKLDLQVTAEDLGVSDPWLLPDNPFYFIKNLVRKGQLLLTFDPLQRIELLVRQNNERTLEAAKLIERDSSRKSVTTALAVLADVQKDFNKVKENAGKLDTLRQKQPERVNKLVDSIIKNGLARQTVFSAISAKVYGQDYVRVEKIRQSILKDGIDSLLKLTGGNVEILVAKLENAVNTGSGSKFKELKAIELLTEIKRFQPEKVDLILEKSEIRLVKKFEAKLLAMNKQEREAELIAYAEDLPGNPVRQFEAYVQLKDSFKNPQTLLLVNHLEDKAVENLRERISEITDASTMQEFAQEIVGNQPEDLKIITEIELRIDTSSTAISEALTPIEQKIEDIKTIVEENIIDQYADDPTGLIESDLFSDPSHENNVGIVDVIVVGELEEVLDRIPEVSPEVITAVGELKEDIINEFIDTVSNTQLSAGTDTLDTQISMTAQTPIESERIDSATTEPLQILEPIPQIIETLVELKDEASPAEDIKIDATIEVQVGLIEEYLQSQADEPEILETYIAQIEGSPVVYKVVQEVGGTEFEQVIEQTTQEIIQSTIEEQTILETTIQQVEEEIFSSPISEPSTVEQTLPEPIQEQIDEIKHEIPAEQASEITITVEATITIEPIQTAPVQTAPAPAVQETAPAPVEQPAAPAGDAPAAPAL